MRKMLSLIAAAAFVASVAVPVLAQNNSVTITGELVDTACALKKGEGGKGEAHAACAMACAKRGQAQGIMTSDAIYNVAAGDYTANNNAKLLDFVAKKVTVTGDVTEKDGQKTIAIKSIKLAN
jgi:type 1 fimbria pilin